MVEDLGCKLCEGASCRALPSSAAAGGGWLVLRAVWAPGQRCAAELHGGNRGVHGSDQWHEVDAGQTRGAGPAA